MPNKDRPKMAPRLMYLNKLGVSCNSGTRQVTKRVLLAGLVYNTVRDATGEEVLLWTTQGLGCCGRDDNDVLGPVK